ncbi:BcepGomrgp23 [Burkholderia phage BcepGomr]|uniref:BcepGomrgp23 n=1 Tax=Burkholderia phage BcepGomr TaxID=437329 RepID=UPI00015034C4|nr:BcepGomrgp23 [Burkholderia phage BcepGomr]ABP63594.1 BcepGomrgp23 [Burkholderia phage BcepGomr]
MAFGLRLYDGGGGLLLNATPNLGRILGVTAVGGDGSLQNGQFGVGRPWFHVQAFNTDNGGMLPEVWMSGTTLNWKYNLSGGVSPATVYIFYGIY